MHDPSKILDRVTLGGGRIVPLEEEWPWTATFKVMLDGSAYILKRSISSRRELEKHQFIHGCCPDRVPRILAHEVWGGSTWFTMRESISASAPSPTSAVELMATIQGACLATVVGGPFAQLTAPFAGNLLDRIRNEFGSSDWLGADISSACDGLRGGLHLLESTSSALCHGDYWSGNIIVTADAGCLAIDWAEAIVAPRLLPLVNYSLCEDCEPAILSALGIGNDEAEWVAGSVAHALLELHTMLEIRDCCGFPVEADSILGALRAAEGWMLGK